MALLPIIYISLMMTAGLIVIVVFVSYISSKLKNQGNEDRILALAYTGTSATREISHQNQSMVQRENRSVKINVIRRENSTPRNEYRSDNNRSKQKTTRVFPTRIQEQVVEKQSNMNKVSAFETRSSSQKHINRIEVINSTLIEPTLSSSSGQVQKSLSFSDPINYYYNYNDREFYTIKAS